MNFLTLIGAMLLSAFHYVGKVLASDWLSGLATLALIATLIVVIKYTQATAKIAQLQEEEIGLKKKPVISIALPPGFNPDFPIFVYNFSSVYAKVRVKATVACNSGTLQLPGGHDYDGTKVWEVQAMGTIGLPFQGHLDLQRVVKENGLSGSDLMALGLKIWIECWVINHSESESGLYLDANKNPLTHWYHRHSVGWVMNIVPPAVPA